MTLEEAKKLLEDAKRDPSKAPHVSRLLEAIKVVTNAAIKKPVVE